MKTLNLKTYVLPDGETVVSYFDSTKNKRVLKKFTEEAKAREFENAIKYRYESKRINPLESERNVERLLTLFLERNPNAFLGKSRKLIREFSEAFGTFDVQDVTEVRLRAFFVQQKNENDYAGRSMYVMKSRLQGFFKFLVDSDVIRQSPLDGIKFERLPPFKRKALIKDEKFFAEIIAKAKRQSPALFYPIFLLIQETAAKTSDILKLQWQSVNFKTREIGLVNSTELQDRMFPISEDLVNALARIEKVCPFVFTGMDGRPMRKHILIRELRRFQRRANFSEDWALTDLRTSRGLIFLRDGGTIRELQKYLGHVRPYQTEQIYRRFLTARPRNLDELPAVQESESFS